jgi:prolyl-tRNA synthetase
VVFVVGSGFKSSIITLRKLVVSASNPAALKSASALKTAPPLKTAISPTREQNYPEWYQQVVEQADLAENSPVRGCMVIKPWGYGLWERIQQKLDEAFKATGHVNAYFPLLIPLRLLQKEADHVAGFAKECAVVTHHRLAADANGKLQPDGALEEPYVIRPTSETIIGEVYANWVKSYRDLPILINQWANVMRWEMRTRMFLRTSEFLWQEGHTVHATAAEAVTEAEMIWQLYADFMRDYLAMPAIMGRKTANERFPGAVETYALESMMQDGKALQMGTSHNLGQNFAKAANIQFLDKDGQHKHAHTTSWGVSTRMIGGLIMTHSDDDGLVLPPRVAASQVVIIPIIRDEAGAEALLAYCEKLAATLRQLSFAGEAVRVQTDKRDLKGSDKFWEWVKRGVPIRLEIGQREMEQDSVTLYRRDLPPKERITLSQAELQQQLPDLLQAMQAGLLARAEALQSGRSYPISNRQQFEEIFGQAGQAEDSRGAKPLGFAIAPWSGDGALEDELKKAYAVTVRCILPEPPASGAVCAFTGAPAREMVILAKSY